MRPFVLWVVLVSVVSASAAGDTVFLRDGRTFTGKVTKQKDTIRIDVGVGIITVPVRDVVHIKTDAVKQPTTGPAAKSQAETQPAGGLTVGRGLDIESARRPEPILFSLMRKLTGIPAGTETFRLREQIKQWRIASQDRKRKVDGRWVGPDYFSSRRKAFAEAMKDRQEMARRVSQMRDRTDQERANKRAMQRREAGKLRKVARTWADPQLRRFLMAIAEYRGENWAAAETLFRSCIAEAPRVPAYHQGHGMALAKLKRHADALAASLTVLHLRPQSRTALSLVRGTMENVRGIDAQDEVYAAAAKMLEAYARDTSRTTGSSRGEVWLMPDTRAWLVKDGSLPLPTYDRLTFVQGVAVPVGGHALLVAEAVVKDAVEVHVRIDEHTVVPGAVRRVGYSRKGSLGLAVVTVEDYTFTPVTVPAPPKKRSGRRKADEKPAADAGRLAAGQEVRIHAVSLHEAMGSRVRLAAGRIKSVGVDGMVMLSSGELLPGESASPALTAEGVLAGFLTGRTDPQGRSGGASHFVDASQIAPLVARLGRSSGTRLGFGSTSRVQRKVTPKPAAGKWFIVHAIKPERFE